MALWNVTWFFENIQGPSSIGNNGAAYGWTESWIVRKPDNQNAHAVLDWAINTCEYLPRRSAFLVNTVTIPWVRVSLIGGRQVKTGNALGRGLLTTSTATTRPAQTTCAVLVTFTAPPLLPDSTPTVTRSQLFRGLRLDMMQGDVLVTGGQPYNALVNFCEWITAAAVDPVNDRMSLGTIAPPAGVHVWHPISALSVRADGLSLSVTAPSFPPSLTGTRVMLKLVTGIFPNVNHQWTIVGNYGNGLYGLGRSRRELGGTWLTSGEMRTFVTDAVTPQNYTIIGLRTKRTGPPFRQPVGRRSD